MRGYEVLQKQTEGLRNKTRALPRNSARRAQGELQDLNAAGEVGRDTCAGPCASDHMKSLCAPRPVLATSRRGELNQILPEFLTFGTLTARGPERL